MRMSKLFSTTLRMAPSGAEIASHQLLLRAGFIRQFGAGVYTYLPLTQRVLNRIESIMREEMARIGGQELKLPVARPVAFRQTIDRLNLVDEEMPQLKGQVGSNTAPATHGVPSVPLKANETWEEVLADLARHEIKSYRQLPQVVYHLQTKFRSNPRARAGLIQAREFSMLNSYSLDSDIEGLNHQYRAHSEAFLNIFNRCGLPVRVVRSDLGSSCDPEAHEFVYLTLVGEDTLLFCTKCDYAANRKVATVSKPEPPYEDPLPLEKVATPGATTIAGLAAYLDVSPKKTAKAVFLMGEMGDDGPSQLVFALLRGDMILNETKLANALKKSGLADVTHFRPATDDEIAAAGANPGYASPLGIDRGKVWLVVDDLLSHSPNLVGGANETGYHLRNINFGRDYQADVVADIVLAEDGAPCPCCGGNMKTQQGIVVGNVNKLGSYFSDAAGAAYLDEEGQPRSIIMGSYGIDVSKLMATIAEEFHDDQGLIWPAAITPYPLHLVVLASRDGSTEKTAETFYEALIKSGLEPLYDDREERAGVKFNDADLIGIPLRITISTRSLKFGGFEFKRRTQDEHWIVPPEKAIETIMGEMDLR